MKKIRLFLSPLLTAAIITVSVSPAYVYADELTPVENADAAAQELTETSEDDLQDVSSDELTYDAVEESGDDITTGMAADTTDDITDGSEASSSESGKCGGWIMDEPGAVMPIPEPENLEFRGTLPKQYSNRNVLPTTRNQGDYGTCWAFSALGGLQADLLMDGIKADFSPLQLAYYASNTYKDPKGCRTDSVTNDGNPQTYLDMGGSLEQGARLLSNHIGAVAESVVPYSTAQTFRGGSGGNEYLTTKDSAHLKAAYYIDSNDTNGLKRAIILHGGISVGYFHSDKYYDKTYKSYYNPTNEGGGHAVLIVGWDDDFPKEDFANVRGIPKGNGAWLVRNSWGSDWGDNGYFWISYYDGALTKDLGLGYLIAYDAVKEKADNCYSYDGQSRANMTINGGKSCSVRETYKVTGGEAVTSVGFELRSADVDARVTVKNKKTGETATGKIHTTYAGMYTVKLKKQLYMSGKTNVEVVIDYSSKNDIRIVCELPGEQPPVIIDKTGGRIVCKGVCDKGVEVKYKSSSKYTKYKYDPRMRIYTVKSKAPSKVPVQSVSLNKSKTNVKKGKKVQLSAKIIPTNATNKNVTWSTSNKKIATVSKKGLVKGIKAGKATITVKTKDGKKKARCKVTVKKK